MTEIGLDKPRLIEAVTRGLSASLECTSSHAPTASGTYAYHEIVRHLRDLYRVDGWEGDDAQNRGLLVNESRTIAILVASGDEATGMREAIPTTKNPKGRTTVQAVRDNTVHWLFSELEQDRADQAALVGMESWMLLVHRDDRKREMRAELSLPVNLNGTYRPDVWRERLLLGIIPFSDSAGDRVFPSSGLTGGRSPEVKIEIRRRA